MTYFTSDTIQEKVIGKGWTIEVFQSYSFPVTEYTTNAFMFALHSKGDKIERHVYSIFDLTGDIGGFKDGIVMLYGWLLFAYNRKWFTIALNRQLFRVKTSSALKLPKSA